MKVKCVQTGRVDAALGAPALRALRSVYTPHLISSSASLNLPAPGISPPLPYRRCFNFAKTTKFQWANGLLRRATFKFIEERNYEAVAAVGVYFFIYIYMYFFLEQNDWPFLQMRKSEKCLFLWATPSASEPQCTGENKRVFASTKQYLD